MHEANAGQDRTVVRTTDRLPALTVLTGASFLLMALAAMGCGWQSASTLGSTVDSDGNAITPDDNPTDADEDPIEPPPDEETAPDEPADPDPDVMPPADDNPDDEIPEHAYCEAVADWDATWAAFENEVLDLVNQHRAAGADCGSVGTFEPVGPVAMNAALRCAARNHSMDMGTREYFDHYTPEGIGPGERLSQAGYSGSGWAENIAWRYATPAAVVSGWMASPGHCANIMRAHFTETGIGYYEGSLWTQTFGRP